MAPPDPTQRPFGQPCTQALRDALLHLGDARLTEDFLFLERWEISPRPDPASALRILQLRRANPELANAIRTELATQRRAARG